MWGMSTLNQTRYIENWWVALFCITSVRLSCIFAYDICLTFPMKCTCNLYDVEPMIHAELDCTYV